MLRRLFTLLSFASLALCVATCVLWGLGHRGQCDVGTSAVRLDGAVVVLTSRGVSWNQHGVGIRSDEAQFLHGQRYDGDMRLVGVPGPADVEEAVAAERFFRGVRFENPFDGRSPEYRRDRQLRPWDPTPGDPTERQYIRVHRAVVPFWAVVATFAVLPVGVGVPRLVRLVQFRRAARAGLCPRCGYDLRATPEKGRALLDRCPDRV